MRVREPLPGVVYPPDEETRAYMAAGELGEEILSVALEIEANLLAGVTEEEKQQLLAILRKVLGNVPTITKAG